MTTHASPASLAAPADDRQDWQTRVLSVPGLDGAAPIGGGCCAIAADDAVREELESWPGITVENIDSAAEIVTVRLQRGESGRLADAVEAVRDLGFPGAGATTL
ncbi:hypothetical protein [Pseudarthrobacter chlorophenolicus]|uniref:HMA domain-containing protein n=1 Tax=Pseudarthrobacter chlorophenolicus (strain ATCC 700700 / DSM 12829 / CIP 107037 / JCM 12360 / KCTC 9906 / NCIMB 13794 / A6) TaxID=452863 RepID=B8HJ63_PSECP|nr:hypothetical protein [Pseudarthrobacter chlorophenolicus]ACL42461.1 hypothetical protein Achl_4510 [Pseudarthrobacter chlorophenolicus A6]SDQ09689.1 hypothetical protein SAMN04489738_0076 [Pseudarthrobacter chlorophenolicus]